MKHLFVSLSLASLTLLAACKNSDDVKALDQIPGEYKITGTTSYTVDGAITSTPLSGTLSVYAGNHPNTYYFMERYSTTELGYLATVTGANFTVQEVPDYSYFNSVKYFGYQKGNGTISANSIKLDRWATTSNSTYIAPTGATYYYNKDIKKYVSVVATK